jgi:imidazolonepropionase-like amidohydrolase
MLLSWPNMRVWHAWWQRKSDDDQQAEIKDNLDRIDALFREGRAYALAADAGLDTLRRDLRLEAMRSLFDGSVPLIVRADQREQIDAAMDLAKQFGLRLIIEGGYDAAEVADRLRTMNVPVILRPVNSLPAHDEDAYDASFTLPLRLEQAGVTYCISDPGFWQVRSLPFHAGTAVAYGLPEEKAIAAITLTPARIFGVDANYGALEPGKSATLFISNGNALDVRGNVVTYAWIDGRSVDLSNRHTRLSEKYRERYSR